MKGVLLLLLVAFVAAAPTYVRRAERQVNADCWTCKQVVTAARSLSGSVQDRLEQVCDHVPSWAQRKCDDYLDRFFDAIVEMDDESKTPEEVCAVSCAKPTLVEELALSESENEEGEEVPAPASHTECGLCELIVGFAEDYVESNATLAKIETFFNTTVCGLLPSILGEECAVLVDEYGPAIAARLEADMTPAHVCKDVGLCANTTSSVRPLVKLVPSADLKPLVKLQPSADLKPLVKLVASQDKPTPESANDVGCTLCTLIVGFAEDKLESNATEAKILEFLNTTVCGLLPSFLRPECAALVDEYGPELANKIEKGYPASVVCEEVGLCPKREEKVVEEPKPEGVGCTICELIVGYAEDKLESNATLTEIEEFLNTTVCGFLPKFLRGECAVLVDQYAPEIAQRIEKGYPASVICQDIHLCSSSAPDVVRPLVKLVPSADLKPLVKLQASADLKPLVKLQASADLKPLVKLVPAHTQDNAIECAICRLVLNAAEEELGNGATDERIEQFLNTTVCTHLPRLFRAPCSDFVESYLPNLVGHVLANNNSTVVCTNDLHLC